MSHGFSEGDIWVVICSETAKLLACNSSGRTVYWHTQEEASQYIASNLGGGWEVPFHKDMDNESKLIHVDEVRNVSKYG